MSAEMHMVITHAILVCWQIIPNASITLCGSGSFMGVCTLNARSPHTDISPHTFFGPLLVRGLLVQCFRYPCLNQMDYLICESKFLQA